jgi:hypothetical protein
MACNTLKGGQPLAVFLADNEVARRNFFVLAKYVWPRHLRAVAEELARRGTAMTGPVFVEGVRGLRGSDATASFDRSSEEGSTESAAVDAAGRRQEGE